MSIKPTMEEAKRTMEEMYAYYMRQGRNIPKESADTESVYSCGKYQGGAEALGALYLWLFGGKAMYKLWEENNHD